MIIVDTSAWIDHLRSNNSIFARLSGDGQILLHPFVLGEIALGNLRDRVAMIAELRDFQVAPVATEEEVLIFIVSHNLAGSGVGYVDAHLLASTILLRDGRIWTLDRRLASLARTMDIAMAEENFH